MEDLISNHIYSNIVSSYANIGYNWEKLQNKAILISGANGMIGSFIVDIIMYLNKSINLNCSIFAISRNLDKSKLRFKSYIDCKEFNIIQGDIVNQINIDYDIDFIIHAASNTHPIAYSNDPIGTITTNLIGTYNLLNLAVEKKVKRFVFLSSVEIYGANINNLNSFSEEEFGYINCNTLRAGYPESKRAGEALCQAFKEKYDLNIVIPRICRVYGPTVLTNDSKAQSQFINKAINNEDIVIKSDGKQYFSYIYAGDAASAILLLLLEGINGEAYNVADDNSNILLKEFAEITASYVGKKVVFELPSDAERKGFSNSSVAILNTDKIKKLNFKPIMSLNDGINTTIDILKSLK